MLYIVYTTAIFAKASKRLRRHDSFLQRTDCGFLFYACNAGLRKSCIFSGKCGMIDEMTEPENNRRVDLYAR